MARFRSIGSILLVVGTLSALPSAASSQADDPVAARAVDVRSYAAALKVSEAEASRRLEVQALAGELEAKIRQSADDIFAGLWLEHRPGFSLEIRFKDVRRGQSLIKPWLGRLPAGTVVNVRPAEVSLAELEGMLESAVQRARETGVAVDAEVNVPRNRVELRTPELSRLQDALDSLDALNPEKVTSIAVAQLAEPAQLQPIRGGRPLSTCSTAFTVSAGNVPGVLTAGHCGNSQTYQDLWVSLPFGSEAYSGNSDVQWHRRVCTTTVPNEFDSGIGIRQVTGTQHRDQQAIGAYVCKHGMTTGRTCGFILSKTVCPSYVPSGKSTFISVSQESGGNMALPGDSGGAFYVETVAYGVTSGYYPDNGNAIYMPINYVSNIGVTVLTQNAGTGSISATVSCSNAYQGSSQVSCWAYATGGVGPYTYQWGYNGSSSNWSGSGTNAYANYSYPGCPANGYNYFYLGVTDSCGQVGYGSATAICFGCSYPGC